MDEFRNGQQNPYGIDRVPDMDSDTYQMTAPSIQQGWTSQVNGPKPTVQASPVGAPAPSSYAPLSAQQNQIRTLHAEPPPQEAGQGGPEQPGMPANTQREYVRHNRGEATEAGQSGELIKQLMSMGQNGNANGQSILPGMEQ